jgi:cytochrome c biogenesis protein CcdA
MAWNQYFPRTFSTAPFSLDWLGTWPITSSAVIPAFLIIFVFGCFSVLNAYMGAFFGVVTAGLVTYWGWVAIPTGYLVVAMGLAIVTGITVAKRRLFT